MNHESKAMHAACRAVGEFKGYIDGEPAVRWFDRTRMPQVGEKLYAGPALASLRHGGEPLRSWAILLTSANHGVVGAAGSQFPCAEDHYERFQVVEIVDAGAPPAPGTDLPGLVRIGIDGTIFPLAAPSAPIGAVLDKLLDDLYLADPLKGDEIQKAKEAIDQHVASQVRAARDAALEEAAEACEKIESDRRDAYKGRGAYAPNNPDRADSRVDGESDGAGACADAIRALKGRPAISHSGEGAAPVLTDEDITNIWQTMPGGPAGWLKSFGFLQFARAVEDEVLSRAQAEKGGAA